MAVAKVGDLGMLQTLAFTNRIAVTIIFDDKKAQMWRNPCKFGSQGPVDLQPKRQRSHASRATGEEHAAGANSHGECGKVRKVHRNLGFNRPPLSSVRVTPGCMVGRDFKGTAQL